MKILRWLSTPPQFYLIVVAIIFVILLYYNPTSESLWHHVVDFTQELLALGILVVVYEASHTRKVDKEMSLSTRKAIAWLVSPNQLQLSAREWVSKFKKERKIDHQPMPFSEIKNFYYEILILAVKMPDFADFSLELDCLKKALVISNKWDVMRSIISGSQVGYNERYVELLKEVEEAADNIKNTWLPYEVENIQEI